MKRIRTTTIAREDSHDDDYDYEVTVRYTVTKGSPQTWEQPAEAPEIDILSARVSAAPGSKHLVGREVGLTDSETATILADHEDDGPDPDDARDRMIDDRLTGTDR